MLAEFLLHQRAIQENIKNSVWQLNHAQIASALSGVIEFPSIVGASVHTIAEEVLAQRGIVSEQEAGLKPFDSTALNQTDRDNVTFSDKLRFLVTWSIPSQASRFF